MIEVRIPLQKAIMPVTPNKKMHHMAVYLRNKKLGAAIRWQFILSGKLQDARSMLDACNGSHEQKKSLLIKICYVRPRLLDDDNNIAALKHSRDCIADLLIPGLEKGQADSDSRLKWEYLQKKGEIREYALEITISEEK